MPTEGEEVPDFNTIFYDKEKKRIVKRTEKKVYIGGHPDKMVSNKTLVHGTHKDPGLIARVGVALTLAIEDNVDRLMTDLEQSRKNAAQLKETLNKERDESQKLKRKYEYMMVEVKSLRIECQNLQADKNALGISADNTDKSAQVTLAELQNLHLEHQMLKTEKDDLQLSYGNLSAENKRLESRVTEL